MIQLSLKEIPQSFRWFFRISLEKLVLLAVVAYFMGWHYVNEYFSQFNVNRSSFSFDDYTTFLYSFYVLAELPNIVLSGSAWALWGSAGVVIMLLIASVELRQPLHVAVGVVRRLLIAVLAVACLFLFSVEAGRSDAQQVIRDREARPISITLTDEFHKALAANRDEQYATGFIGKLTETGDLGGLALIWRNDDETLVLLYDTTKGSSLGRALRAYRISNEFIAMIDSSVKSTESSPTSDSKKN